MNGAIIPSDINETITRGQMSFTRRGNVVTYYGSLSGLATGSSIVYDTLPSEFRPKDTYAVSPLYSNSSPYTPIGSIWIDNNTTPTIAIYKGSQTSAYASGTYVTA